MRLLNVIPVLMKTTIHILLFLLLSPLFFYGQITTPLINAKFGVDGDLRANYYKGAIVSGNDDWFSNGTGTGGTFVIDTTGAKAIMDAYKADASPWPVRMSSFYRTMNLLHPPFSIVGF